jgi:general secretion pathway protein H
MAHPVAKALTQISARGMFRRGFTLIELLVVLAIIGISVALVAVHAAPDERASVELEAERLAQLLDLASEEARLTAKPIAWSSDGRGYRFTRYSADGGWSEVRDSPALRARVLPEGIAVANVRLENGAERARHLVFSPCTPAPIFSIALAGASTSFRVTGSPIGDLRVERADRHGGADVR